MMNPQDMALRQSDKASRFQLLHALPPELLDLILSYLDRPSQATLNLTSKWTRSLALSLLWQHVVLTDQTTHREDDEADFHDDTPLLRKLLLLATNPDLARHVQILEHKCHLPPAGIFNELPNTPFSGPTLSPDPRTRELVVRAVKGMRRVHTVRIIFGHPALNDALLRCLFDKKREKEYPIRRLWLEDCRIAAGCDLHFPGHPLGLPEELDFNGLESLRFRRMPLRPKMEPEGRVMWPQGFNHARGSRMFELQDGRGGLFVTSANLVADETMSSLTEDELEWDDQAWEESGLVELFTLPFKWDDEIFEDLARDFGEMPAGLTPDTPFNYRRRAEMASRGPLLDPVETGELSREHQLRQRERLPAATVAVNILRNANATLTSLCFDWVLAEPYNTTDDTTGAGQTRWLNICTDLFSLRFPNLRAFQYRNAVVAKTLLPSGLSLLDPMGYSVNCNERVHAAEHETLRQRLNMACLEFMEAHSNLQCLAWPMESFFSASKANTDFTDRVQAVIDNLGRNLVDLRVDTMYSSSGERQSESTLCDSIRQREQRRRFIAEFASKMTKVESIKIEGGVPRDERRETLRALRHCPLNKIVLIGVCCPIGNTWGEAGADLMSAAPTLDVDEILTLEAEHKDAIHRLGHTKPEPPSLDQPFEPSYGWPPSPPMIHTIASHHASTITELKFCGYKGAPVLFDPIPITAPMLAPLKHFHNLRTLIMSFCLVTTFEGAPRDHEIIKYWLDSRSPTTTSLVRVNSGGDDIGGWERELNTKYAPQALAGQVTRQLGPMLSEEAKAREGGVSVRASMCLGDWGGIFDIDVVIGKGGIDEAMDVCLGFKGPREELEEERKRGKLEGRRWF